MQDGKIRVLLAEPEILIAMDIERILTDVLLLPCAFSFCKCIATSEFGSADLVVCAVDDDIEGQFGALRRLSLTGTAIVILTTQEELFVWEKPPWPFVLKPYDERALVAAVTAAMNGLPANIA